MNKIFSFDKWVGVLCLTIISNSLYICMYMYLYFTLINSIHILFWGKF